MTPINSIQTHSNALVEKIDPAGILTEDPFLVILHNLPLRDLTVNCVLVSKKWKVLSEDNRLWIPLAKVFKIHAEQNLLSNDVRGKDKVKDSFVEFFKDIISDECATIPMNIFAETLSEAAQKIIFQIAKVAATLIPQNVSEDIIHYPIQQTALRMVIAKTAATTDPSIWIHLSNFKITPATTQEQEQYQDLLYFIFINSILKLKEFTLSNLYEVFLEYYKNFHLTDMTVYFCEFRLYHDTCISFTQETYDKKIQECLDRTQNYFQMSKEEFNWYLQTDAKLISTPLLRGHLLDWYLTAASICTIHPELNSLFKAQQATLRKISEQHPNLHTSLAKELISLPYFKNQERWERLTKAAEGCEAVEMAALVLANFPLTGDESFLKAIRMWKEESFFKDKNVWTLHLETLIKIKNCRLESDHKVALVVLLTTLPMEVRFKALNLIHDALTFNGETFLKKAKNLNDLQGALEELFINKFEIKIPNFLDNYQNTLGKWRNKTALMTFLQKLKSLPEDDRQLALSLSSKLLKHVLTGEYQKIRYETSKNPHLAEIERTHPKIFLKWQENLKLDNQDRYQVIETDDPNHILLMGTEVYGSSLNVDASPSFTKVLLGNWLDGKNRLCLVCNEHGTIVARTLLRILIDTQGRPVLYMSDYYTVADAEDNHFKSKYLALLTSIAKKKAIYLGIPLVNTYILPQAEKLIDYPYRLQAKEKPVPYEYVANLQSQQPGPYEIRGCYTLYDPNE